MHIEDDLPILQFLPISFPIVRGVVFKKIRIEDMMEKIECAAIKSSYDNKIYALERPSRHNDIISYMAFTVGLPRPIKGAQGFLTDRGRFVDRVKAMEIVKISNQPTVGWELHMDILFSEDLW